MEYFIIAITALIASSLTLFTGFGLGTLMLPVFAVFLPLHIAVGATAIVHLANNIFKLLIVGKYADRNVVIRFGVPAVMAAVVGAILLGYLSHQQIRYTYSLGGYVAEITLIKMVMSFLIAVFALFELLPVFRRLDFDPKYFILGGCLSGFFGGLSGHQGALRAAFLAKSNLTTEAFVGSNVVIGFFVDIVRIALYAITFLYYSRVHQFEFLHWSYVVTGVLFAFAGVIFAKGFMHRVKMRAVQIFVGIIMLVIAGLLGAGVI